MTTGYKQEQWDRLTRRLETLRKQKKAGLRKLTAVELRELIDDYQAVTTDLARARSLGAPPSTIDRLNRIAVTGHHLLYSAMRPRRTVRWREALGVFARAVRGSLGAVGVSAACLFGPAVITYFAIQSDPAIAYELVPDAFLEFDPAREDTLHEIPSIAQPVVSSAIITNNIQVTLLAFGLGLTAGVGTTFILVANGLHLGAIAGWLALEGKGRALWGWVMPHGGTELLAICLSGAAGYLLAGAILAPGYRRRSRALKEVGRRALVIALGCMGMLVIAGLIEGFVSPSGLGFAGRVGIFVLTLLGWGGYLIFGGRRVPNPGTIGD